MGGHGSGRKFGLNCTEDYRSIDVRRWQRDGYLVPGQNLNWRWSRDDESITVISVKVELSQVRLIYRYRSYGSDWENMNYPVSLQTTPCHFGGVRYWFICPTAKCGRLVAVLYMGSKFFACRHCYRLIYRSQKETSDTRADRKANKIRKQLGWPVGIAFPIGGKPKGMHWKTYFRLKAEYDECADQALLGMSATLEVIENRLSNLMFYK